MSRSVAVGYTICEHESAECVRIQPTPSTPPADQPGVGILGYGFGYRCSYFIHLISGQRASNRRAVGRNQAAKRWSGVQRRNALWSSPWAKPWCGVHGRHTPWSRLIGEYDHHGRVSGGKRGGSILTSDETAARFAGAVMAHHEMTGPEPRHGPGGMQREARSGPPLPRGIVIQCTPCA